MQAEAQRPSRLAEPMESAAPFYIPATAPNTRPRHVLKYGDSFAIFDSYGDVGVSGGGSDGLFDHDTRYLSRFELLIEGMQPLPLGSSVRDDNLTLTSDLTNTDIFHDEHTGISIMVGIATVRLNLLRRPKSFCSASLSTLRSLNPTFIV
jgi:hypothetical protein